MFLPYELLGEVCYDSLRTTVEFRRCALIKWSNLCISHEVFSAREHYFR